MGEFLWYIPNTVEAGVRGDDVPSGWADLEQSVTLARMTEDHGWGGALFGTSWGRPDTFTVATAIAARTTTFKPLIAVRPGYWRPAHFASAAATLDHLTGGRVLVNIVSGHDNLAAYGDHEADRAARYSRTREFLQVVRLLWTQENVTFRGEHFQVEGATVVPRPHGAEHGRHPRLYFGGASPEAESVAAAEADVQLFWGEPRPLRARRGPRLLPLHGAGQGRRRRRGHHLAGRRLRRGRRRPPQVRRPGHLPLHPLRHPLPARMCPNRRRATTPRPRRRRRSARLNQITARSAGRASTLHAGRIPRVPHRHARSASRR
jgi:alkanesulfonate monooxygenase SsuD/methylene tetrahydromethanopterin reductase-like flavin-dependent oxidoreductase (luciferase family)